MSKIYFELKLLVQIQIDSVLLNTFLQYKSLHY